MTRRAYCLILAQIGLWYTLVLIALDGDWQDFFDSDLQPETETSSLRSENDIFNSRGSAQSSYNLVPYPMVANLEIVEREAALSHYISAQQQSQSESLRRAAEKMQALLEGQSVAFQNKNVGERRYCMKNCPDFLEIAAADKSLD